MSDTLRLSGMVIQAAPAGDYDKRVVLLTKERGKITAFARGARRPKSALLASTGVFCFGTFEVYEGRSAYTLVRTQISNYFSDLVQDLDGSFYGSYFLELAGYYAQENLDASQMLNLLYVSLRALENPSLPNRLVRYIYEIRLMVQGGEYPQDMANDPRLLESTRYTISWAISAPLRRLYTFTVTPEVLEELAACQDKVRASTLDRVPKSLELLEMLEKGAE